MNPTELVAVARSMMAPGRGLLAMDESNPTCDKRFAELGIPQTPRARHDYRQLIVTTPGLAESISGAILFEETFDDTLDTGETFVDALTKAGIVPGIKVDAGTTDLPGFPGEKVTEGLDKLSDRARRFRQAGARFAKWRAVITIADGLPTPECVAANAHALARYAATCQAAGLVPIVEPEVLMDGPHDLDRCAAVTERVIRGVFAALAEHRVLLEGMVLKPNMVLPGLAAPRQDDVDAVADATVRTLLRAVPAAVAGVAFLSGGQPGELATARLNAMNARFGDRLPWPLTFSFSRAIQQEALQTWAGRPENADAAQRVLLHRARCNAAARRGQYTPAMETPGAAA